MNQPCCKRGRISAALNFAYKERSEVAAFFVLGGGNRNIGFRIAGQGLEPAERDHLPAIIIAGGMVTEVAGLRVGRA